MIFPAFPTRDTVSVSGADALSFLQSLLSQDLSGLGVGEGAHALLLQPQGKLDVDLRVVRTGEEDITLDCEAGFGDALVASLRRFKIRVKAEITNTSAVTGVLAVRGAIPHIAAAPGVTPVPSDWPAPWTGPDTGTPVPGVDFVGPVGGLAALAAELRSGGAVAVTAEGWEAARVAAGVPRQGRDIDERTIPQEAFLDRDAVSFTKGCFLGQELVCRIDTRGHVNRYLRGFEVHMEGDATTPAPGTGIVWGEKEVGALTTVAATSDTIIALGYLRRDVEVPAQVTVRGDRRSWSATARATGLPGAWGTA